jgi:hypothetical protein
MATFPSSVGIQSMTMRLRAAVARTTSPFTFDQQTTVHPGVRWEAEVTLPPLERSDAKAVEGFLAEVIRGETFTLGNPLHDLPGASGSVSGTVGSTSVSLSVSGAGVGDYFDIGDRLYIITGASSIMPPLRGGGSCNFSSPQGKWVLASNEVDWNVDRASVYGFTFACVESL